MKLVSESRCFGGRQLNYGHDSRETGTAMRFAVYAPPQAEHGPVPVLWWLSGLTCTEDNFMQKAGAQRVAAELGIMLIAPDTSPRGEGVPDDPEGAFDFGLGASFYVDATQPPWSANYRMFSYLTRELPDLVATELPVDMDRQAISGHSMGGHGALTIGLRCPGRFRSVSAFAPICAPSGSPWGEKAFSRYLGPDRSAWRAYDATALIEDGAKRPDILIDQGEADPWLAAQLHPERLQAACAAAGQPIEVRMRAGYDHSHFFISTFIEDHLRRHAQTLFA